MALILNIETSSKICSVALCNGNQIIGYAASSGDNDHSANLTVFIDKIMTDTGHSYKSLDAVSVSKGPGSYTGLRIGVSVAKGLCYGARKSLIGICTLESLVYGALQKADTKKIIENKKQVLLCPMIDARRMEVYTALYDFNLNQASEIKAEILNENSYAEQLAVSTLIFFGNGAEKFRNIITNPNAIFLSNIESSALLMTNLSNTYFEQKKFENIAYFEPFYLKDFVATVPKKRL